MKRAVVLHGDCLRQIPEAVDRAGGRFDLVYVDPPFNAGGRRRARRGRGDRTTGADAYSDAWGGLDAFLSMLTPRLSAMRDSMTDEAASFFTWTTAPFDAKVAADGVFGRIGYRGEIVWVPGNGARRRMDSSVTHPERCSSTRRDAT